MNAPYRLEEMPRQVKALADDVRGLVTPLADQTRAVIAAVDVADISHVVLTGNGDSYHAALAAEMAFTSLAAVRCTPLSTLRLLKYGLPTAPEAARGTLVVAISASGGNVRALQVLARAHEAGARTLAVTSTPGSPLAQAADHALLAPLTGLRPCPGIRTYQASLLGLFLLAIELGWVRGHHTAAQAEQYQAELSATSDAIEATRSAIAPICTQRGSTLADAPVVMMLGCGPGYGGALFAAAKLVEAAGLFAVGQDLEEWEHVEALAQPRDMPTIILATPGYSHERAVIVAEQARSIGRTVIAVADAADTDLVKLADIMPLHGAGREEFSPLLTQVFAGQLAYETARQLDRVPFSTKH
ncbi:SIS domain-containing protein [Nonomuraea insulae]|uniref:Glutamine--fructose-6-phosphate aminotransferase [isomerizing] n=1 Tax=Nonomuraea insulae TaxID=1616787 RepID=A0ABW1CR28_9ACTN